MQGLKLLVSKAVIYRLVLSSSQNCIPNPTPFWSLFLCGHSHNKRQKPKLTWLRAEGLEKKERNILTIANVTKSLFSCLEAAKTMLCYGRDRAIHAFHLFTRLQIRVSKSDQNMNVGIGYILPMVLLLLTASKQDVCCTKGGDDLFDVMNSLGDISCKIAPCIRDPPQGKMTIQAD